MKKLFILFILFSFSSCVTTKQIAQEEQKMMNAWVGHTKAELLQKWGPPKSTTSDAQGGEIISYEKSMSFGQTPGQVYSNSDSKNIYYTNPKSKIATRIYNFYIDKSGKIYTWLLNGREGY